VKAFVVTAPHDAQLREWPDPTKGEGEVSIAPLLAGVCGTDLELIDGTIDPAYVRYPLTLGHEWVGRLEHDLDGVGPAGTSVVVEGIIPCGVCPACCRGATNLCEIYDEVGFTRAGAIAEHISVPEQLVHAIADDVDLDDAVLIEPMAVVWRALTRMPLRTGQRVAIIGDGTVALLAAHLVQLFEPHRTTVFGRRDEQHDLALRAGADEFTTSVPSEAFDLVIEASGSIAGVASSIASCARGGMVILLGLPPHGETVEFSPDELVNHDAIIQGSFSYSRSAFADVVARVNAHDLRPSFLITHRFDLDDAASAVVALRGEGSKEPRGKVVIAVAPRKR
jgi:threonine dehydrogenase-like Zn-dependent dehydrogenase